MCAQAQPLHPKAVSGRPQPNCKSLGKHFLV